METRGGLNGDACIPIAAMCYDNTNFLPFSFRIAMAVNSCVPTPCRSADRQTEDFGRVDPGQARIVELRFFGSFTVEETVQVMGISTQPVKHERQIARAGPDHELAAGKPIDP